MDVDRAYAGAGTGASGELKNSKEDEREKESVAGVEVEGKDGEGSSRHRAQSRVRDDNRKQALERLGVFVPKSKEENELAALRHQVSQLSDNLERERAQRFRDEQTIKSQQEKAGVSASAELASLSRKLHAEREAHNSEVSSLREKVLKDIEDQIAKNRGPVYEKLNAEMLAILQAQLNSGKGELYERVMIGAKAAVLRDCENNRSGAAYAAIRDTVESGIREDFVMRRGAFYEEVSGDIKGAFLIEMREEQEAERQRVLGIERELFAKHHAAVEEARTALVAHHAELRAEVERNVEQQNATFMESYAAEVDKVSRSWAERFTKREQEWRKDLTRVEQSHSDDLKSLVNELAQASEEASAASAAWTEKFSQQETAFREELRAESAQRDVERKAQAEKMAQGTKLVIERLSEIAKTCSASVMEVAEKGSRDALTAMGDHLTKLESIEKAHGERLTTELAAGAERLERCLAALQQARESDNAAEEARHAQQLDAMESLMAQEKQAYNRSLESINAFHENERKAFKTLMCEEQQRAANEKSACIAELRDEYEGLTASLKTQHELESERLNKREIVLVDRESALEQLIRKTQAEATEKAELEATKRWQRVLDERQKSWAAEEDQRRTESEARIEARHSIIVQQLEASLGAAKELRVHEDEKWALEQKKLLQAQHEREESFKQVCTAIFETRMEAFRKESDEKVAQLNEKMLKQAATHAEITCRLESQVANAKNEAAEAHRAYIDKLHTSLGAQRRQESEFHASQIGELGRCLQAKETECEALRSLLAKGHHETVLHRIKDAHELHELKAEQRANKIKEKAGSTVMQDHRERILQLWSVLRLDVSEYVSFLLSVFEKCEFSPDMQARFEREVKLLSDKVPLIRLIADREMLKHEVRSMSMEERDENTMMHRDVALARLGVATHKLQLAFQRFEESHPRQKIFYKGVDYKQQLEIEVPQMPDVILAPGALAHDQDNEFEV